MKKALLFLLIMLSATVVFSQKSKKQKKAEYKQMQRDSIEAASLADSISKVYYQQMVADSIAFYEYNLMSLDSIKKADSIFKVWQSLNAITKVEEYDYITQNYKIQLENGLIKEGYRVEDMNDYTIKLSPNENTERTLRFRKVVREESYSVCALIMIVEQKEPNKQIRQDFYCIPLPKSDEILWNRLYEQIRSHSKETDSQSYYYEVIFGLMRFLSDYGMPGE
jgi:hypothetical protein